MSSAGKRLPAGWRFTIDSLSLLAGQIASAGALAAVAVLTARVLGPADRGRLTLILTVVALVQVVSTLGLPYAALMLIPRRVVAMREFLGLSIGLIVVNAPLVGLVALVALPVAGTDLGLGDAAGIAVYGATALAAQLPVAALQADGRFRLGATLTALGSCTGLVLTVAVWQAGDPTPMGFVWALVGGNVVQSAFAAAALRRHGRPVLSMPALRRLLSVGGAAVGLNVGQTGAMRADRYVIGALLEPRAVGLYSVAATATELLRTLPFSATMDLLQRLSSGAASDAQIRRAKSIGLLATGLLGAAAALLAPLIIDLVFGAEYAGAATSLRILVIGEMLLSAFLFDATVLVGRAHMSRAAVAALLGFAFVIALDIPFIRMWGIEGAAWASVGAYAAMAGCTAMQRRSTAAEPRSTVPIINE